ncbi:MAG: Cell envelope-related transcriptional attenuator [Candidatus Peregrinibacteria bacterium GW2011_GWA2_43_8]|nr:MAG: Cell envelope-related transcriptional attenuator [Candidatus Peregrinibacteria bacterium GW2011_GWA2_43_8]
MGIGGGEHDGAELTDSIIIASLDLENNLIPMLSIPRDLYIEYEEGYGDRINRYYELSKLEYEEAGYQEAEAQKLALEDTSIKIGGIIGIDIQYYALIDFSGFTEIVDAIGGIDVYLESSFYDDQYPLDETGLYTTFALPTGENHLDGEDALKYARSRKTTSDFDRALRQQQILNAIKEKTLSMGVLTSPSKIKDLLDAISSNFMTNLTLSEMAYLGEIADDFSEDSMLSRVFNDAPYSVGGFLYVPPQDLYGGSAVLVPNSEDFSELATFSEFFLHNPSMYTNPTPLQIVNGVKYEGLATNTLYYLDRYGFDVVRYGNAPEIGQATTTIYNLAGENLTNTDTLEYLQKLIPMAKVTDIIPEKYQSQNWETEASIIIELGEDFIPFYEENYSKNFYYWPQ